MPKLKWDSIGEKIYETGTKRGVLYPIDSDNTYKKGYAWNGLTAVTESPSGAEPTDLYADDIKYVSIRSAEEYGGTIEAYTYPPEFGECDGSKEVAPGVIIGLQGRKSFALSFVTTVGNDTQQNDYGYKLHLVWGATASPSEKSYSTINDSPDAVTFSWEFDTTPIPVTGFKPTSNMVIDSTKIDAEKLKAIEDILYGTEENEPRMPLPDEIITLLGTAG